MLLSVHSLYTVAVYSTLSTVVFNYVYRNDHTEYDQLIITDEYNNQNANE